MEQQRKKDHNRGVTKSCIKKESMYLHGVDGYDKRTKHEKNIILLNSKFKSNSDCAIVFLAIKSSKQEYTRIYLETKKLYKIFRKNWYSTYTKEIF